jgi:hypothetical protein
MSNIGLWLDIKTARDLQGFIRDERLERQTILQMLIKENNNDVVAMGELLGLLCAVERMLSEALELAANDEIKITAKGASA